MKKLSLLLAFFSFVFNFNAQINLVPNPSFEDTTGGCPDNVSQLNKTKFWFNTNGTADYFSRCYNGSFDYTNIPKNSFGYQNTIASNCNAYCGILTYWPYNINTETLCSKLNDSLLIGTKYYFSIKVSLANTKYATNNIGVFFSTKIPSIAAVGNPPNNSNIKFNQVIIDTLNWTSLYSSYIPDSNYKYISIGNFYNASLTNTVLVNPSGTQGAYYFIDDICISTDSSFAFNYRFNCLSTNTSEKERGLKNLEVFPNPAGEKIIITSPNTQKILVKIYDLGGICVLEREENGTGEIAINNFLNGIYFLELKYGNVTQRQKLIIQK